MLLWRESFPCIIHQIYSYCSSSVKSVNGVMKNIRIVKLDQHLTKLWQGCKRDVQAQDQDETETLVFQSETRPRPRPSHFSSRDRDVEFLVRDEIEAKTLSYFPETDTSPRRWISAPR